MIESVMINAVLSVGGMSLLAGLGLGYAAKKFHVEVNPIAERLEKALPSSNCGSCGFPGCKAYAEALTTGNTEINLCTPGGKATMQEISLILGVAPKALVGEGPLLAFIDEIICIGCTACIRACPVDAIVGANKQAHTVLRDWCTGCKKCVEPCPVDCISMVGKSTSLYDWRWSKPKGPRVH